MSSISYGKFGDTLPVTSMIALSQAAVGFGVGLLIAGKLDQTVRQRTAIAFIGAGAATILQLVAGAIADFNNRPDSSRRIRRQLASIREGTGLSNGDGAYWAAADKPGVQFSTSINLATIAGTGAAVTVEFS